MIIGVADLIAAGVAPTQARTFAEPLAAACLHFDISSAERIAAFIGQCMLESAVFTRCEEDLFYRTPARLLTVFSGHIHSLEQAAQLVGHPKALAETVYAGVNGNRLPGDAWQFRGRGLVQLTGRANYERAAATTGRPYVDQPDLVALPPDACLSAAAFWHTHGLNLLADAWRLDDITRAINPPMLNAALRRSYADRVFRAIAPQAPPPTSTSPPGARQ